MKIDFEYGQGTMTAELPDNTDIFIPGETVPDPDYIPEDKLEEAYLDSLAHPIGMPTLSELAHKGTTVTIIVPDRVKGGEQPTSHRKMSIKYILQELYKAGVEKKDILFIISNGLHPRSKESDVKAIFGKELFDEFWHSGQIISHDSEDQEHMVYLGTTHRGDPVYMNKYVRMRPANPDRTCTGKSVWRIFRRLQAQRNRNYKLEMYCKPPRSVCYAQT